MTPGLGKVQVRGSAAFTGGVVEMDTLQNNHSSGSAHVTIEAHLMNNGFIRNQSYGLTMDLTGDFTHNGAPLAGKTGATLISTAWSPLPDRSCAR